MLCGIVSVLVGVVIVAEALTSTVAMMTAVVMLGGWLGAAVIFDAVIDVEGRVGKEELIVELRVEDAVTRETVRVEVVLRVVVVLVFALAVDFEASDEEVALTRISAVPEVVTVLRDL